MKKYAFASLSVFLLSAADAIACDYASPSSIEEHSSSVDAMFIGKAIETQRVDIPSGYIQLWDRITTFEVIESIKGDIDKLVLVRHPSYDDGDCTVEFEIGQTYEVFAINSEEGQYYTNEMYQAPYSRENSGWTWDDYREASKKN